MTASSQFIYPYIRYYGDVKPENLVFHANLQEFAQQVSIISSLTSGGKLSPSEAFDQIDKLWQTLAKSKQLLGVGENPFTP